MKNVKWLSLALVCALLLGLLLILEKFVLKKWLDRAPAAVGHLYTIFLTLIGWVLFAFDDLSECLRYLGTMFGVNAPFFASHAGYYFLSYLPLLMICCIAATPLGKKLRERLAGTAKAGSLTAAADAVCLLAVLVLSLIFLISGSYNPFLYFRF